MFEQAFKNIDDVLRKEAGCTTELDYTEQTSWLLFLKYLDGLEQDRAMEAGLEGKKYAFILDEPYRWDSWAAPKGKDGKLDHNKAMTGDDLRDFVDQKLFPYLHGFTQKASGPNTIEYKIGADLRRDPEQDLRAAIICARSSTTSTNCASARRPKSTSCRRSTKKRSSAWAMPGAMAASITPRAH